jgi:hypothetical protein
MDEIGFMCRMWYMCTGSYIVHDKNSLRQQTMLVLDKSPMFQRSFLPSSLGNFADGGGREYFLPFKCRSFKWHNGISHMEFALWEF